MVTYLSLELKSPQPLPCLTDTCVVSSKAGLQLRSSTIEISLQARLHRYSQGIERELTIVSTYSSTFSTLRYFEYLNKLS